jgi:hypothetical protein
VIRGYSGRTANEWKPALVLTSRSVEREQRLQWSRL